MTDDSKAKFPAVLPPSKPPLERASNLRAVGTIALAVSLVMAALSFGAPAAHPAFLTLTIVLAIIGAGLRIEGAVIEPRTHDTEKAPES